MGDIEILKLIYELAQQNATHIEILNKEMGGVLQNLEWLNWCIRGIIAGICISIVLSIWNLWLHKLSNNKKEK